MTRICSNCEFENQDDYDFCAKCGNPLVGGVKQNNFVLYQAQPQLNKKAIIISYIVTIFLSWSGFIVSLFSKHSSVGIFTFFGFFLPFYLMQSPVRELKRHGYIQLIISVIGVALSFYVMLN
jgi:hypothetical protein